MLTRLEVQRIRQRLGYFAAEPWHAGRRHGRTLYNGEGEDDGVGYMDTRRLAARVIQLQYDALALQAALDEALALLENRQ
jgi:hypothetical protein